MKKTLLAALSRRVGARCLRRRRRRADAAAGDLGSAGEREPVAGRLHRLPADCSSPRWPTCSSRSTPAPSCRLPTTPASRPRSTETARVAASSATLSIAAMRSLHALTGALAAGLFLACAAGAVDAAPITPTRDDEVIEVLPASAGNRGEDRQLRKRLAARPDDAKLATAVARRYLEQARESGDPRFAGLALAALRAWPDADRRPRRRAAPARDARAVSPRVRCRGRAPASAARTARQRAAVAGLADAGDGAARPGPLCGVRCGVPRGRSAGAEST